MSRWVSDEDQAEHVSWLRQAVTLPIRIATGLGLPEHTRNSQVVMELVGELRLDLESTAPETDRFLLHIVKMADALLTQVEFTTTGHFATELARTSAANKTIDELNALADDFGWRNETAVHNTATWGNLDLAATECFERLLSNRLLGMLHSWQRAGVLGGKVHQPPSRKRRRAS
jgi:hypothetical protein